MSIFWRWEEPSLSMESVGVLCSRFLCSKVDRFSSSMRLDAHKQPPLAQASRTCHVLW